MEMTPSSTTFAIEKATSWKAVPTARLESGPSELATPCIIYIYIYSERRKLKHTIHSKYLQTHLYIIITGSPAYVCPRKLGRAHPTAKTPGHPNTQTPPTLPWFFFFFTLFWPMATAFRRNKTSTTFVRSRRVEHCL